MEKKNIRKVLVVALDNLGDAVMATSILKPIRRLHPGAEIALWVKNYAAGLFADQSLMDRVHASDPFWDKAPGRGKGRWMDFLGTMAEIRRERYDLAIILNTEWRRALACRLMGIPNRVGFARRLSGLLLTQAVPYRSGDPLGGQRHCVDDNRRLLEAWSGEALTQEECTPRLDLTAEELRFWAAWSKESGWTDRGFIAIHPFSGDEVRNWPLSCWIELMQRLHAEHRDSRFLVLCGPGEEKKVEIIGRYLPAGVFRVLAAAPLSQVKALLARARVAVGGDSGPGHVAAALGTPVLSLFGDSDPARCRPLGRSALRVLKRTPIRFLPVPDVQAEVQAFLSASPAPVKV